MKIYNKKFFVSGILMLLLGMLNLILGLIRADFDFAQGVLIIAMLLFGGNFTFRSLNYKMSRTDILEEKDERNQLVLLKNRSKAFQIQRYVCLGASAVFIAVAVIIKTEKFEYIGAGFAFAFVISLVVDIATFVYYDSRC